MNILIPEETVKMLERFYGCDDGVIRNVNVFFTTTTRPTQITVILSVRDKEVQSSHSWVNLCLNLTDVKEFRVMDSSKQSYQVLSNGLHIQHFDGFFFIDFGFHVDAPAIASEFRSSNFYFVTRLLSWEVRQYGEDA